MLSHVCGCQLGPGGENICTPDVNFTRLALGEWVSANFE